MVVNLLRILVVAVIGFMIFKFVSPNHKLSGDTSFPVPAKTAAKSLGGSSVGFQTIPEPWSLPNGTVLISEGSNAGAEGNERANVLVAGLTADNIRFTRTRNLPLESSFPPSDEQTARLHAILNGAQPLVFVNNKYCNNPSLAQVEDEYGYVRR